MEPQVGFLVQYHVRTQDAHKNGNSLLAAAVITRVFDAQTGCCNLKVLWNSTETPGFETSVLMGEDAGQWSPISHRLEITSAPAPQSEPAPAPTTAG